jgi:DNA excision repair protein ERCC-3
LDTREIIEGLSALSKHYLSPDIIDFITLHTRSYGNIHLVLSDGSYSLQSEDSNIINALKNDHIISTVIISDEAQTFENRIPSSSLIQQNADLTAEEALEVKNICAMDLFTLFDEEFPIYTESTSKILLDFPEPNASNLSLKLISSGSVEIVKKRCTDLNFPLLQEYAFHDDILMPKLDIDLKPKTKLRDYQQGALSKMFGSGRARSGIIALPWYIIIN